MRGVQYRFRLFVAGDEANSSKAIQNLQALCRKHLPDRHHIEVVDVVQDFEAALRAQVLVAPALVLDAPFSAMLFGALTDEAKVLAALGLGDAHHGE